MWPDVDISIVGISISVDDCNSAYDSEIDSGCDNKTNPDKSSKTGKG